MNETSSFWLWLRLFLMSVAILVNVIILIIFALTWGPNRPPEMLVTLPIGDTHPLLALAKQRCELFTSQFRASIVARSPRSRFLSCHLAQ